MDLLERSNCIAPRHPWEVSRSKFFIDLLRQLTPDPAPLQCLDVGAGDAWFAEQLIGVLPVSSQMTCWDVNYSTEDLVPPANRPDSMTLTVDQPRTKFGGILMLDVVEHVGDDVGFVANIVETCLDDNGWILVSVPAYQSLFTSHDTAVKHFRRYSPHQCAEMLRTAGLEVTYQGGLFHSLLAVRGAQVAREWFKKPNKDWVGAGGWSGGPRLTRAVTRALGAESRMSMLLATKAKRTVPGLSYWAFCRRATNQ
jgi:hypothetical protein